MLGLVPTESAESPPPAAAESAAQPSPALPDEAEFAGAVRRRRLGSSAQWLGMSFGAWALAIGGFFFFGSFLRPVQGAFFAITAAAGIAFSAWGVLRGVSTLLQRDRRRTPWERFVVVVATLVNLFMTALGAGLAYMATFGFARGRQIRSWGRVLLPPVAAGDAWARVPTAIGGAPLPGALAQAWRDNGKTEHASVAAFARLTLDLVALGAPPELVATASEDALDEIRHAELCFSLARSIDGAAESPAAFPEAQRGGVLRVPRAVALARLAVDSLIDGALHEGVSARIVAKLARRCEVPAIRAMLKEIAADEGRHAAHGWDVVAWCLAEGGAGVAHAMLGALQGMPEAMRSSLPEAARDGAWERWGIPGQALEREEYARALELLGRRVRAATVRLAA